MRSNLVDVQATWVRETERAICVRLDDDMTEVWLPKSQIEYELEAAPGLVLLSLPETLAVQKGIV
jgi:hypothetical protein